MITKPLPLTGILVHPKDLEDEVRLPRDVHCRQVKGDVEGDGVAHVELVVDRGRVRVRLDGLAGHLVHVEDGVVQRELRVRWGGLKKEKKKRAKDSR